ncbi:MAG: protein-glutamate O-methyltransferase CheR [Bacillota bacterium]
MMTFETFKEKVRAGLGFDLNSYKEKQIRRRIGALMSRRQVADYAAYYRLLVADPAAQREFLDYLTINVTEFFRDPHLFQFLEQRVLPELLARRPFLRVWSAACANGAEPYSVAILLEELTPGRRHRIEATDIDPGILEVARAGRYAADLLRHVSPARRARFFRQENGTWAVADEIRRRVAFRVHDLLTQAYGSGYDLIVCRNVAIYFTREAQERINAGFWRALVPGGVLFVGASESIFNYREIGFEKVGTCFYRKVADARLQTEAR